jgi:hypothetical protein
MQRRMPDVMKRAETVEQLDGVWEEVAGIFQETTGALAAASPREMAIIRRISRLTYRQRCIEGAAVQA